MNEFVAAGGKVDPATGKPQQETADLYSSVNISMPGITNAKDRNEIKHSVWSERVLWKAVNERCAAAGITCQVQVGKCKAASAPTMTAKPPATSYPVLLDWTMTDKRPNMEY